MKLKKIKKIVLDLMKSFLTGVEANLRIDLMASFKIRKNIFDLFTIVINIRGFRISLLTIRKINSYGHSLLYVSISNNLFSNYKYSIHLNFLYLSKHFYINFINNFIIF